MKGAEVSRSGAFRPPSIDPDVPFLFINLMLLLLLSQRTALGRRPEPCGPNACRPVAAAHAGLASSSGALPTSSGFRNGFRPAGLSGAYGNSPHAEGSGGRSIHAPRGGHRRLHPSRAPKFCHGPVPCLLCPHGPGPWKLPEGTCPAQSCHPGLQVVATWPLCKPHHCLRLWTHVTPRCPVSSQPHSKERL